MQKIIHCGNLKIPALGLGTYKLIGKAGEQAIAEAIGLGYRHIDTAAFYDNEAEVGTAIKNAGIAKAEIFLTTKVWPSSFAKKLFVPGVQDSLRKLKVDAVDLLLLHWPADEETNKLALGLLLECYEKQYAKHVGVSNFSLAQCEAALQLAPISCNQVEYNPHKCLPDLAGYLQQQDIVLTAYSPLARGAVLNEPVIQQLAAQYNRTGSQIALRWLLQQNNVAAIPKASTGKHCMENMQVFDFELADEDMLQIFRLCKP